MQPEKEKAQEFMEKYHALVDEMKIDFANYPVYMPDGQGGFRTIIQSTPVIIKDLDPIESPFVAKE